MSKVEEQLQQRLEMLEGGNPLEVCLADLSEDEAALLSLAAGLRKMPELARDRDVVAAQRAAVLKLASRENQAVGHSQGENSAKQIASRRWLPVVAFAGAAAFLLLCIFAVVVSGVVGWRVFQDEKVAQAPAAEPEVATPLGTTFGAENPQMATLVEARGLVEVWNEGEGWTTADAGGPLSTGARLRTGALSGVTLAFYDGSRAVLGPDTEIAVTELDAATEGVPRMIVLAQASGETEHYVIPAADTDSRYEVHTSAGVGVARGTVFRVQVTPEQQSRFSVDEGRVAVTNAEATVMVEAGQLTTVEPDAEPSEPVFRIAGEGQVTQTGETWIIGGQVFAVHENTVIVGNPQVGDWVFVEGRLLPDDTRLADTIVLLRRSPVNRFSLVGLVEALADGTWTVAGQTIAVDAETEVKGEIAVGDLVRVEGIILNGGGLYAQRIWPVEASGLPFEFTGVVQTIGETSWTVSGVTVAVSATTEIEAGLAVGDVVKVEGRILNDGTWMAYEIKHAEDEDRAFEFTGVIESIDPWVVSGIAFETRDWTEIAPGLSVGERVKVKGQILADGTWIASEIKRLEEDELLRFVFVGVVISVDPWIVSGIPLPVDEETRIVGEVHVGMLVRVEIQVLPDGAWRVVEIRPLRAGGWEPGCFQFGGTVVSFDGHLLQLVNWPPLYLDEDAEVVGDVVPGSVVLFQVCFADDGTMRVVYIVVIRPPAPIVVPPPPPPDSGGDKVTICHKPNSKNPHTITISRSALQSHLDHGDTLGPCP